MPRRKKVETPAEAGAAFAASPLTRPQDDTSTVMDWGQTLGPAQEAPAPAPAPDLYQQLGGALSVANLPVEAWQYAVDKRAQEAIPPDPTFRVLDHLTDEEKANASHYVEADSQAELDAIRARVDRQRVAKHYAADGPLPALVAYGLAAVGDPTTWVPVGAGLNAARGASAAVRVARGTTEGLAMGGAVEGAQQVLTEERSKAEALLSVGMFGIAGAAGGLLSPAAKRAAVKDAAGMAQFAVSPGAAPVAAESGGAAATRTAAQIAEDADNSLLVGAKAISKYRDVMGKIGMNAPALDLKTSPSAASRSLVDQLVDTGLMTKGELKGISTEAAPVSARNARADAMIHEVDKIVDATYKEAADLGLTRSQFHDAVGESMAGAKKGTPIIDDLAASLREKVLKPLGERLKKVPGFKDIDPETYFTRNYAIEKIVRGFRNAEGKTFREAVAEFIAKQGDDAAEYADDIARSAEEQIRMAPAGRAPVLKVLSRGSMKERTLQIPDSVLEPWLNRDVMEVLAKYIKTTTHDLNFHDRFGTLDVEELIKPVRDDYDKLAKDINSNPEIVGPKREAALKALDKRREIDEAQLKHIYNSVRGLHAAPADRTMTPMVMASKALRTWSFTKSMGGVVLSQLADPFTLTAREGFHRVFGVALSDMLTGFKGIRMSIAEAQRGGAILELANSHRVLHMLDLADRYSARGKFDKAMTWTADKFAMWTGLNHMNAATKGWAAASAMTRILDTAEALLKAGGDTSAISATDLRRMATSRLTPHDMLAIAREAEHFETVGAIKVANSHLWKNQRARDAFMDALTLDVDAAILTPGAGDVPRWTATEVGKSVTQFKKFMLASQTRVMLAGMQRHDAATIGSLAGAIAIGAASEYFRNLTSASGRDRNEKMTTRQWIVKGIDRSGYAGAAFELTNIPTSFGVPTRQLIEGTDIKNPPTAQQRVSPLGASAGLILQIGDAFGDVLTGNVNDRTPHKFRVLAPTQNHVVLSHLWDMAEKK